MRKLGEQWVEELDGKKHMLKAVELTDSDFIDRIAMGEGGTCCICPLYKQCKASGNMEDFCPVGDSSSERSDYDDIFIKDLGILNEDGCLPNCWGEYPRIEERVDVHTKEHWFRCITRNNVYCATDSYKTKQEAVDAWDRRA